MPAIAPIVLNDGQTTPVAHTFSVVSQDGSKASWADRSSTITSGWRTLTHEVRRSSSATAADRILIGFNLPVESTVNGVTSVIRNSSIQVVINHSRDATAQEKSDALAYAANVLANANIANSIKNVEPFY